MRCACSCYFKSRGSRPRRWDRALTVFELPHAARERRGNKSISCTTFRVYSERTLVYWAARLHEHGIANSDITTPDGRLTLEFDDPEGTQLALIEDGGAGVAFPWDASPVPAEHQIRGLGYVVITVLTLDPTARFLTQRASASRKRST